MQFPLPRAAVLLVSLVCTLPHAGSAQSTNGLVPSSVLARIRDEGLNRSKVMETMAQLTDVIGPRLTGSPQLKRANEWTRDQMAAWGLTNAALEPWGTFGRGWSLQAFSAQLTEPESMPLIAAPRAWSPALAKPIEAEVVFLDAPTDADLEKYKGRLKGAIVLLGPPREVKTRFEPPATRLTETNLLKLANAGDPGARNPLPYEIQGNSPRSTPPATNAVTPGRSPATNAPTAAATPAPAPRPNGPARPPRNGPISRTTFVMEEGAALLVTASSRGEGGALFAESASLPSQIPNGFQPQTNWNANGNGNGTPATNQFGRTPWSTNPPPFLPQIVLAAEHYNRLVRLARSGQKLRARVELQARYHTDDLQGYNTIAEMPGSDLKDELVMLGGHLDSWHTGTGATDNAAGVAVCMEAVRILRALNLQPRRTIRVALWSGEEQGLLGSAAYVRQHFGTMTNLTAGQIEAARAQSPNGRDQARDRRRGNDRPERRLVPGPEHDKLSAYYNLDNGAGRIRGIYLQGLEAARPLFRQWLSPFADLSADTITLSNTGGTDHLPFVGVGLPGFQFIQDSLDYWTLTHHSNMDVYDRIIPEDLKQASVIMAAVIYQTAMLDEKLPRKAKW